MSNWKKIQTKLRYIDLDDFFGYDFERTNNTYKIGKCDCIKLQSFWMAKNTINKTKMQTTNHTSYKGVVLWMEFWLALRSTQGTGEAYLWVWLGGLWRYGPKVCVWLLAFTFLALLPYSASWSPWIKQLSFAITYYHDISALKQDNNGLNPQTMSQITTVLLNSGLLALPPSNPLCLHDRCCLW